MRPHALMAFLLLAASAPALAADGPRARLRELGIAVGQYTPGRWNAITDVAGVKVGQVTRVEGDDVRTGVTAVWPRDDVWHHKVFAASFVLNGNGEMTGLAWVKEAGWLETPIVLTDTLSVGRASDAVVSWMERRYPQMGHAEDVVLPVVAECDDGFLNDQRGRHVREQDVLQALDSAKSGPVAEGAVGAGTGMVCYRFKGGIGTASRVLPKEAGGFTVGVLVNCNMGVRTDLRIDGVPVGREIKGWMPLDKVGEGSIVMVVATDAPLLPHELERLAKRAALGLARTGSTARHSSGDLMLAFSTAADLPAESPTATTTVTMVANSAITPLFEATVESAEEAVDNALTAATTTVGRGGDTAYALPLDELVTVMRRYGHDAHLPR